MNFQFFYLLNIITMTDIRHRELKMQEARKNTPWREFVKEIWSRYSLIFYRSKSLICKNSENYRIWWVISYIEFEEYREKLLYNWINFSWVFFKDLGNLFKNSLFSSTARWWNNENSNYADSVYNTKNTYLTSIAVYDCENILYSFHIKENCYNIINSNMVWVHSNNVYYSSGIIRSQYIFYSKYILNSSNIWFSSNLNWCDNCIFCDWLENKSFCINNNQYAKEEFLKKKIGILMQKNNFHNFFLSLSKLWKNFWSNDVKWSFLIGCSNLLWYSSYQTKKWNNVVFVWWEHFNENIYDTIIWWSPSSSDLYWNIRCWGNSQKIYNSSNINNCMNIYYSYGLMACSYCLGCIGLKNKSFCILNKQYTKEEWFEKANEIFTQMGKDWQLWKFFPASMNPFYFNDTVAYLIDDTFTKEEVIAEWYLRRDEEIKVDIPDGFQVVKNTELNNYQGFDSAWNRTIDPEILKKVIVDEKWNAYRIIKMEYDFLMKYWLPLPELYRLDRIKLGFKFK